MHAYAKMYIDDKVYDILSLDFGFDQKIRSNGTICSLPQGGCFNIKLDAGSDTLFFRWAASNDLRKEVKIVFYPVTEDRNLRTIELYDVQCVKYDCDFNARDTEPIITSIRLSPGIIVQNDQLMMEKWWRHTPLSKLKKENRFVNPRPLDHSDEITPPDVINCYYEDEQGQRLKKPIKGKIFAVVESRNAVGKKVSLKLNEKRVTFIHGGEEIVNGELNGITIRNRKHREEIEVL